MDYDFDTNDFYGIEDEIYGFEEGTNTEKKRNWKFILLMIVLISAVVFCAGNIIYKLWTYYDEGQDYISVRDSFIDMDWTEDNEDSSTVTIVPLESEEETTLTIADLYYPITNIDHDGLNATNEDYVAWIYFEDGGVNYPIMSGSEYIHENIYNETTSSGSIFIDDDASEDFSDLVTFIYGHNMYDMSMFGTLKTLYNNIENLETPYFFIETEDGTIHTYFVFAICKTTSGSNLYTIPAKSNYSSYLSLVRQSSSYFQDCDELTQENNIVVLSTCYGASGTNNRVLIYGVERLS